MKRLLGIALLAAGAAQAAPFVAGPYKHLEQGRGNGHVIRASDGTPYAQPGRAPLTWAFATGECGEERWGDESADAVAQANVAAFAAAGVGYIVSTGGAEGVFTCATDAGMERFVARYASPRLIGFDFDIEAGQTPEQVDSIVRRAQEAQRKRPGLRLSFTVPTLAAADGSRRSLTAVGELVLAAIRRAGLTDYVLNLMVMDYGPPAPDTCVVAGARCDMGWSAQQAAVNVHERYGVPYAQIELTPMLGVNDVAANEFTLADARRVAQVARALGLAGVHFWSLDRDRPCATPGGKASPVCSGVTDPAGAYGEALLR